MAKHGRTVYNKRGPDAVRPGPIRRSVLNLRDATDKIQSWPRLPRHQKVKGGWDDQRKGRRR